VRLALLSPRSQRCSVCCQVRSALLSQGLALLSLCLALLSPRSQRCSICCQVRSALLSQGLALLSLRLALCRC
jgi:hypothetical protein